MPILVSLLIAAVCLGLGAVFLYPWDEDKEPETPKFSGLHTGGKPPKRSVKDERTNHS